MKRAMQVSLAVERHGEQDEMRKDAGGSAKVLTSADDWECPICADLLCNPVCLPCGHDFCSLCIKDWMDQHKFMASCPVCRKRPRVLQSEDLGVCTRLRSLIEQLFPDRAAERKEEVERELAARAATAAAAAAAAATVEEPVATPPAPPAHPASPRRSPRAASPYGVETATLGQLLRRLLEAEQLHRRTPWTLDQSGAASASAVAAGVGGYERAQGTGARSARTGEASEQALFSQFAQAAAQEPVSQNLLQVLMAQWSSMAASPAPRPGGAAGGDGHAGPGGDGGGDDAAVAAASPSPGGSRGTPTHARPASGALMAEVLSLRHSLAAARATPIGAWAGGAPGTGLRRWPPTSLQPLPPPHHHHLPWMATFPLANRRASEQDSPQHAARSAAASVAESGGDGSAVGGDGAHAPAAGAEPQGASGLMASLLDLRPDGAAPAGGSHGTRAAAPVPPPLLAPSAADGRAVDRRAAGGGGGTAGGAHATAGASGLRPGTSPSPSWWLHIAEDLFMAAPDGHPSLAQHRPRPVADPPSSAAWQHPQPPPALPQLQPPPQQQPPPLSALAHIIDLQQRHMDRAGGRQPQSRSLARAGSSPPRMEALPRLGDALDYWPQPAAPPLRQLPPPQPQQPQQQPLSDGALYRAPRVSAIPWRQYTAQQHNATQPHADTPRRLSPPADAWHRMPAATPEPTGGGALPAPGGSGGGGGAGAAPVRPPHGPRAGTGADDAGAAAGPPSWWHLLEAVASTSAAWPEAGLGGGSALAAVAPRLPLPPPLLLPPLVLPPLAPTPPMPRLLAGEARGAALGEDAGAQPVSGAGGSAADPVLPSWPSSLRAPRTSSVRRQRVAAAAAERSSAAPGRSGAGAGGERGAAAPRPEARGEASPLRGGGSGAPSDALDPLRLRERVARLNREVQELQRSIGETVHAAAAVRAAATAGSDWIVPPSPDSPGAVDARATPTAPAPERRASPLLPSMAAATRSAAARGALPGAARGPDAAEGVGASGAGADAGDGSNRVLVEVVNMLLGIGGPPGGLPQAAAAAGGGGDGLASPQPPHPGSAGSGGAPQAGGDGDDAQAVGALGTGGMLVAQPRAGGGAPDPRRADRLREGLAAALAAAATTAARRRVRQPAWSRALAAAGRGCRRL